MQIKTWMQRPQKGSVALTLELVGAKEIKRAIRISTHCPFLAKPVIFDIYESSLPLVLFVVETDFISDCSAAITW